MPCIRIGVLPISKKERKCHVGKTHKANVGSENGTSNSGETRAEGLMKLGCCHMIDIGPNGNNINMAPM